MVDKNSLKNKRIAAIDYGLKRIGIAVCDQFHITVTPRETLLSAAPDFWESLLKIFGRDEIKAIVIGYPYREDGKKTEVTDAIDKFIPRLEKKSGLTVIKFDESYSSLRAMDVMIEIGVKKKNRRKKDKVDRIAAAVILRDFLNELDN